MKPCFIWLTLRGGLILGLYVGAWARVFMTFQIQFGPFTSNITASWVNSSVVPPPPPPFNRLPHLKLTVIARKGAAIKGASSLHIGRFCD